MSHHTYFRVLGTHEPFIFLGAGRPTSQHTCFWVLGDQRAITYFSGCWATNKPSHVDSRMFWVLGDQRAILIFLGAGRPRAENINVAQYTEDRRSRLRDQVSPDLSNQPYGCLPCPRASSPNSRTLLSGNSLAAPPAHQRSSSAALHTCSANYSIVDFLLCAAAVRDTQPIQPAQLA